MKRILFFLPFILTLTIILSSCGDDSANNSRLQISLTDAPGDYEALHLDVQGVEIKYGDDDTWKSEGNVYVGSYDVLKLTNGDDTLLVDAVLPATKIHQIRLILGDNNYLTVDGTNYALKVPSGQTSGLKLNVQQEIQDGLAYKIVLDFDVAKSIVERGGPEPYILKPVIRTYLDAYGGSISGTIAPFDADAVIYAMNGADTVASAYPNDSGEFLIAGLPDATYTIVVSTSAGVNVTTDNLVVSTGNITVAGVIEL